MLQINAYCLRQNVPVDNEAATLSICRRVPFGEALRQILTETIIKITVVDRSRRRR